MGNELGITVGDTVGTNVGEPVALDAFVTFVQFCFCGSHGVGENVGSGVGA